MAAALKGQQQQQQQQKDKTDFEIPPPVYLYIDMSDEMKQHTAHVANKGIKSMIKGEKRYWKDIAEYMKKQMEEKYPGAWHIVVGKNWGSYVTHESKNMAYFTIGQVSFLVYKHG